MEEELGVLVLEREGDGSAGDVTRTFPAGDSVRDDVMVAIETENQVGV